MYPKPTPEAGEAGAGFHAPTRIVLTDDMMFAAVGSGQGSCASSPLVWGPMAVLLMRLTQGLFDGLEARFNMHVDDILLQTCGTPAERTRVLAITLLWLAVLRFPVAFHKVKFGVAVDWIGARFEWTESGLRVTAPAKRRDEVLLLIQ